MYCGPDLPLCLSLYWMSLRFSPPRLVLRSRLWTSQLQPEGKRSVCGWVWVPGVSSLWVRARPKEWARAKGAGTAFPSRRPGPRCMPGHGCGGIHPSRRPPPAAWCGGPLHGYAPPPAGRRVTEEFRITWCHYWNDVHPEQAYNTSLLHDKNTKWFHDTRLTLTHFITPPPPL